MLLPRLPSEATCGSMDSGPPRAPPGGPPRPTDIPHSCAMRNVLFAAPFPLETTFRFVRAAASLPGVRLLGVVAQRPEGADARLFADIVTVSDPFDPRQLVEAAHLLQRRHGPLSRVTGILEPLMVPLAHVREAFDLPGLGVDTAELFRDKGRMKDALRQAGLPCARHRVLRAPEDATSFADEVGFPLVVKPIAGMGSKATWRIRSADELRAAVGALRVSPERPAIAEEFLQGREYSFETITIDGVPRFTSFSRYFPTPLEVLENPWIQWSVLHPRAVDGPEFDDARQLGLDALKALGLDTAFTHMEWFRRDDGSLAIGEIAARPPGAQIVPGNNFVHDADFHRAWANAVILDRFDTATERKYAVAVAFLRGIGQGRVARIHGREAAHAAVGHLVVESRLPRIGAQRADTYEGDGFVILRHPDTDTVKAALKTVLETIRIEYAR
ncbi:MAG: ATP-grasp domain-containing protein [Deltaproteobacteria bacterium]|nr:MAG: ATP-grasp domain-containing protein [Deltaproteobacteria bacterium]